MGMLTVSCPSCGFSRQLPEEKVPEGPRRVTCPHCKEVFVYTKPTDPSTNEGASPDGSSEAAASAPPSEPLTQRAAASASHDDSTNAAVEEPSASGHETPPGAPPVLTDIGELFRKSWELYQKQFASLVLLYFLAIMAIVVPALVTVGLAVFVTLLTGGLAFLITVSLGVLVGVVGFLWCYGGFLLAVLDDTLRLEDALRNGKKLILPLAWIFLLSGFIVTGGYLLLIVPGIIFTVWFSFVQFIVPGENIRGIAALLKSREYIRGYWFEVALRLFLVWVVSGLVGAVPLFGPILALLFFPYLMIFHCLIYRDLRNIKGDVSYPHETKNKFLWPGVALIGWIVVITTLIFLFSSLDFGKFRKGTPVRLETTCGENGLRDVPTNASFRIETKNGL